MNAHEFDLKPRANKSSFKLSVIKENIVVTYPE